MNKINAIIIDDEPSARQTLNALLEKFFPQINVIAQADSIQSGIDILNSHNPDLVFRDIEMPHGHIFDILENVNNLNYEIIFITAHNQYALEAFRFSAIDYLLKPVKISDLTRAIERFEKRAGSGEQKEKIKVLIDNLNQEVNRIVLPTGSGFEVASVSDIIRCEGERNYTRFIFTNGNKILVSKTLKEFEDLLCNYGFYRIHQSHVINLKHVKKYFKGKNPEVEMSDSQILPISRNRKEEFLTKFI